MKIEPKWDFEWVDTDIALQKWAKILSSEALISLDTETVGWETGNERLCLVQIGIPTKRHVLIVDALAFQRLDPLAECLSSRTPNLVAHNAAFEEKQLGRFGLKLRGVIDTLNMARKLRPDLPNHTLQTCARLLLNMQISKEEQTSNWAQRPLSQDQLDYARLDAEIALQLYEYLANIESKLSIDPALTVEDLMKQLAETLTEKIRLTKDISFDLAVLNARNEMLREVIKNKLVQGEPEYEGQYGKCKVSKIKRTEISPIKVRENMPGLADLAISEYVERDRLKALMKEHGIADSKLEEVMDVVGYTDRLSLTVKDLY
jgi:3'-5' exonuclease